VVDAIQRLDLEGTMSLAHRALTRLTTSFWATVRSLAVRSLAVASLLGTAACSDGSPRDVTAAVPAPDSVLGMYVLVSVNAQPLPYVDGREVWEGARLTLNSDQSLSLVLSWHETDDAGGTIDEGTDSTTGTYALLGGNRLTLVIADDDPVAAVLVGETLTLTSGGDVFVFVRQ
jgi:hypothetical protein